MSSEGKTGLFEERKNMQLPFGSVCEALDAMGYQSIGRTCFECLKDIADSATKTCRECLRSCHLECLIQQGERSTEVRKQLALPDFTCRSCQHPTKCLQCRNQLGDFDTNIYCCSVCLRLVHHRCHYVPVQIATLPHSYHTQVMCQHCLHHFGVREVLERRTTESGEFVLVVSNHLSPVHATWIPAAALVDSFRKTLEERLLLSCSYEVEIVLSMHVPSSFRTLTMEQCEEMLTRDEFYSHGKMCETFKFLTKWRHTQNKFVWEQASVFSQCRHQVLKFLHQVKMNSISFLNVPKFITVSSLQSCIQAYRLRHGIHVGNASMSDKRTTHIVCQMRDEESGEKIDLRTVYSIYQKQRKQYLNIKNLKLKIQAILDLISNIYFLGKNPAPVAIFTDQPCCSWWITKILQKTPYLSAISLHGQPSHIQRVVSRFLIKQNGEEIILKFNILIISYQSLKMVSSLVNLPQILDSLSLLVMDQKMTALARYYYSRVKIARIKFHKEMKEEKIALLNARCQLPDQGSFSLKKSSLTLSSSHNKQLTQNHQNRTQIKSNIQASCQFFYANFFRNGVIDEKFMGESERMIFLRYIMAFGLNCADRNELCLRIIKFQPTFFSQSSHTIARLETYLSYFLAHLYTLASNKLFNQAEDEIKRYFFFRLHPKRLLKLIAQLARIKAFCELYEKNAPQLQAPIPSVMFGGMGGRWNSRYDFIICRKVVAHGYGKWELICRRPEQWKELYSFTTFPQLLSEATQAEADLKGCCEFLQMRLEEIAEHIEKTSV